MPLKIEVAPVALPVTVAEAKTFARVALSDDFDEYDLVHNLIEAATEHVQQVTARQFVRATFKLTLRCFPLDDLIRLPRSPLCSVQYVKYRDHDGSLNSLVKDVDYFLDDAAEPVTIEPVKSWPAVGDFPDAVQVRFIAGYKTDGESPPNHAANVPARAKVAIKALVAHWFEQREPVAFGAVHEVPHHVTRLINGIRLWRAA